MGRKKSIDDIRQEFFNKGYELLSTEYVNAKTKLSFICSKHKDCGVQYVDYNHFKYRNAGCHYCAKEKQLVNQRFSYDKAKMLTESKGFEFVDIKYGSELNKNTALIYYKCPTHMHVGIQSKTITQMKHNDGGCPYCKRVLDTVTLQQKINHILPHVKVCGEYSGQKHNVLCYCTIHDEYFYGKPYKLSQGVCGCSQCKQENRRKQMVLTKEEYVSRLQQIHPELVVVGEYVDSTTPIEMYCATHDIFFYESPNTYLYKKKQACCPMCNVQAKTNVEFQTQLHDRFCGDIIALDKYSCRTQLMTFKCIKHNIVWKTTPAKILQGKGCPKCCASKNEVNISNVLDQEHISYIMQKRFDDCKDIRSLPFDFYLPDYNMCIEYDGEGHYLESFYSCRTNNPKKILERVQYHDSLKTNYCESHNITLLRIPYWEQKNITQILKNELEKYNIKKLVC